MSTEDEYRRAEIVVDLSRIKQNVEELCTAVAAHSDGPAVMVVVKADDGVSVIDALYRIRTDDGTVIVVHNNGLYEDPAHSPRGRSYLVTRPIFAAPDGKYDWLNRSLFIGTVDDMPGGVLVSVHEVLMPEAAF